MISIAFDFGVCGMIEPHWLVKCPPSLNFIRVATDEGLDLTETKVLKLGKNENEV